MHFIFHLFVCFLFLSITSCNKETEGGTLVPLETGNRDIKITVTHLYQISPSFVDSIVPGAVVRIYDYRENWAEEINHEAIQETDSAGIALFKFRTEDYYWIRATHPELGDIVDSVSTPPGTLSFVNLIYY